MFCYFDDLYRELEWIYKQHYEKCEHQAVHDIFRAIKRRLRRFSFLPYLKDRNITFYRDGSDWICRVVLFINGFNRFDFRFRVPASYFEDPDCVEIYLPTLFETVATYKEETECPKN